MLKKINPKIDFFLVRKIMDFLLKPRSFTLLFLIIVGVAVLLSLVVLTKPFQQKSQVSPQEVQQSTIVSPRELWNSKIIDKFYDEPDVAGDAYKIRSSSAWLVPSDPDVIRVTASSDWMINMLNGVYPLGIKKSDIDKNWETSLHMKQSLAEFIKKNNLSNEYYDFFYWGSQVPRVLEEADVTGDGKKEKLFTSHGAGCASCHLQFIDIVTKDNTYSTSINSGSIYPRLDKKGFYLTVAYMGEEFSTCCKNKDIVKKYEWNGNGFTEIARKTVWY